MTDVHDKETRSYNMSQIKGRDTKPETVVRSYLHSQGLRFRLHNKKLPGKPDITLRKYQTVIFVNGCFWHGHKKCKYFVLPKTRTEWWKNKIVSTKKRDQKNLDKLKKNGWTPLVIWECELKPNKREENLKRTLINILKGAKK
ncbi:very short patch repair endonuclease [Sediminibacterium sp. KACHI17]|uniref:Very short patch repair endonuclease n=1 Tax=Sediminibacterium sp. KACHI17 TaxID=1751071 RepID=A0AAT9GHD0_9BACT